MIGRYITWRVRHSDVGGWTGKTGYWLGKRGVSLSFTIEPARTNSIVNKNARIIVRKREEGKKVANKVLFSKQISSSYHAKNIIDALLYTAIMFHEDDADLGEQWFLDSLRGYKGAPPPKNSNYITNNGKGSTN